MVAFRWFYQKGLQTDEAYGELPARLHSAHAQLCQLALSVCGAQCSCATTAVPEGRDLHLTQVREQRRERKGLDTSCLLPAASAGSVRKRVLIRKQQGFLAAQASRTPPQHPMPLSVRGVLPATAFADASALCWTPQLTFDCSCSVESRAYVFWEDQPPAEPEREIDPTQSFFQPRA